MSKIRISAAIASKTGVTLYLENGDEMNLAKDSWRTKAIMDDVVPRLARREIVEIDLDTFSIESRIEQKSGGLIRFVKEKFSKVRGWFSADEKPTTVVNNVTIIKAPDTAKPAAPTVSTAPVATRPIPKVEEGAERTVAVVGGKRIPGVDALEKQMEVAAYGEGFAGFQNFMKRIASVIDTRSHTVDELLNFMRRGDLPIADDGSIVAYKVLTSEGQKEGIFIDIHSKKVTQRLGSFVRMDEKLIDHDRRHECSTGLHIARRGYLNGFRGDVITLVKVAPEDVVAVPPNEPNKMRAAGYHIVAVLPQAVHTTLHSNKPMTDNKEAATILADVIAGRHTPVLEIVNIGSAYGGNVTVTPTGAEGPKIESGNVEAKALDDSNVVSVKEIREKAEAAIKSPEAPTGLTTAAERASAAKVTETAPEPEKRASKPEKPKQQKLVKTHVSQIKPKKPEPAPKTAVAKQLTEKQQFLLKLLTDGGSQREIARQHNVCAKTLRKLWKEHGPKDAAE